MNRLQSYPKELVDEVTFLPEIPQAELNANGLFVVQGVTVALAEQLVVRSKEAPIGVMCQNDSTNIYDTADTDMKKKRFLTVDSIRKWQEKGRLSVPLVREAVGSDSDLELMGFGWMGPGSPDVKKGEPEVPGATITFAVRLYEGATGQGNAPHYTRAITDTHDYHFGSEGVWLEAWGDNTNALKAYENDGFLEVARIDGNRHGQPVERVYMTLGILSAQAA